MTENEVLAVKTYAEGAYPQMKSEKASDFVWVDMLSPYDLNTAMVSLQTYIKSGNRFPPTVADIIKGCGEAQKNQDEEFIAYLDNLGMFREAGEDDEVSRWNKDNREQKARNWLAHPLREKAWPEWFRLLYTAFREKKLLLK